MVWLGELWAELLAVSIAGLLLGVAARVVEHWAHRH